MIPFLTLLRREIARFLKVLVQTVISPVMSSLFYLIVFGVSLGSQIGTQNGISYLAFLIPGLLMMGLMNNAFQNSSSSITAAKYTGELEDLRIVPLSLNHIIWALGCGSVIRGAVVGAITFMVGCGFHLWTNGQWLTIDHPFWLIYFVGIGGLVFGNLGIAAAFWAKSFDQLSALSTFILLPLTYLGGVFVSIEKLSPFWKGLAELNPVLYFINGIRYSILGVSDVGPLKCLTVSLIGLFLTHLLAQYALRKGSFHRW